MRRIRDDPHFKGTLLNRQTLAKNSRFDGLYIAANANREYEEYNESRDEKDLQLAWNSVWVAINQGPKDVVYPARNLILEMKPAVDGKYI